MSKIVYSTGDVADEFGTPELAISRALALGALKGSLIAGAWKFSSDQLQDFIGRGCPSLGLPPLAAGDNWLDTATIDRFAADIEQRLRNMLDEIVPATRPAEAAHGESTTLNVQPTDKMKQYLAAPPSRDRFSVPGSRPIQFKTNSDIFAASKQSAILGRLCADPTNLTFGLQMLYRSPNDFRRQCAAAQAQFANLCVVTHKTYRPAGSYGLGSDVYFQVSCKDFGASPDVLTKLV